MGIAEKLWRGSSATMESALGILKCLAIYFHSVHLSISNLGSLERKTMLEKKLVETNHGSPVQDHERLDLMNSFTYM